jgi:hypothetical protein
MAAQQLSAMSAAVPANRTTDPTSRTPAAVTAASVAAAADHAASYKYTSQEEIDKYMRQAREAGPLYAKRAEEWLATVLQWKNTWAPSLRDQTAATDQHDAPPTTASMGARGPTV